MRKSVSMLETSSTCSVTNHASMVRAAWSLVEIAWSIRALICRVTIIS
jgi:hypothetical protein